MEKPEGGNIMNENPQILLVRIIEDQGRNATLNASTTKPGESKKEPEKTIKFETDPIIQEKIPDGYPGSTLHNYTNILQAASNYCEKERRCAYMENSIKDLKEANITMAYLYYYAVEYVSSLNESERESIMDAVQSTLDEYSENRAHAIRLINLLQTPSEYKMDDLKLKFKEVISSAGDCITSLEKTLDVELVTND